MVEPQPDSAVTPQALFSQGLALHQAGQLQDALLHYQQVLAVDPSHFEALHLLGVACLQTGQTELGVQFIEHAIRLQPGLVQAHGNLANGLNSLGRYAEALASCERAIALAPDFAEAHGNRALALHQLHGAAAALPSYQRAAVLQPSAKAWFNLGAMLRELDRFDEALAAFDRALALSPDHAEALYGRGIALRELGRPQEALAAFDRAIALRWRHPPSHYDRAVALRDLGQLEEALVAYDQAIAFNRDYAEAYNNRGNVLIELKHYDQALRSFDRAIAIRPDYAEAWSNRSIALKALLRPEEALDSSLKALALRPDYADGHNNHGSALYEFQRLDEALASFDRAIALKPDLVEAHTNRGVLLHQLRRFEEANESFDRALMLRPDDAEAHFNQAMSRLALGDYDRGWRQYERRWGTKQFEEGVRDMAQPLWLGEESLEGRTILLHGEQGLGDILQFCRYVAPVAARGAKVIVETHAGLERLMARLDGVDSVVTRGARLPPHDLQTPLLSLPLALHAPPEAHNGPYLSADPVDTVRWAERLAAAPGADARMKVGICWAGGSRPDQPIAHAIDLRRSLPLDAFAPLAAIDGVQLYSLQKGPPSAQLSAWTGPPIVDLTGELTDFADTAALVANLDLVIACDTSTAHLAGGLGKPVWVLNRFDACWRWLDGRRDSPWYPTARLFRQATPGDWEGVIADVGRELVSRAG